MRRTLAYAAMTKGEAQRSIRIFYEVDREERLRMSIQQSMLAKVNFPEDIRHFSLGELNRLAGEIREVMIGTVSRRGGHLASSLGTVELTLAIHYVFDTPRGPLPRGGGGQGHAPQIHPRRGGGFGTPPPTE